jgi:hypothetical protein
MGQAQSSRGRCRAQIVAHRNAEPPAGFDNRDDGCDAWAGFLAANVDPILTSKRDRTYRILGAIVTQLQFGILQEPGQPCPERQCVITGFSQHTLWQGARASCLDLGFDLSQKPLGLLQTQGVTSFSA